MPKDFKSLPDIIYQEKAFEKIRRAAQEYDVIEQFNEIFPELEKVAKAVRIDSPVLFLRVENSVWRSELNLKKNLIIDKINKHFSKKIIKTIKFIA